MKLSRENVNVIMLLNHVFHELYFNSVIAYFSDSSLRVISIFLVAVCDVFIVLQ